MRGPAPARFRFRAASAPDGTLRQPHTSSNVTSVKNTLSSTCSKKWLAKQVRDAEPATCREGRLLASSRYRGQ